MKPYSISTRPALIAFGVIAMIFFLGIWFWGSWGTGRSTIPVYRYAAEDGKFANNSLRLEQYADYAQQGDVSAWHDLERNGYIERLPAGQKVEVIETRRNGHVRIRPFGTTRFLFTLPEFLLDHPIPEPSR